MPTRVVDAFLAYHDQEDKVVQINAWLSDNGVATHFFRRDIKFGDSIDEDETLFNAATVVVFLGDGGWGPTQRALVQAAADRNIPLVPVLIGSPHEEAKAELNGLFRDRLYLDMREISAARLGELRASILRWSRTRDIDVARIVRNLVDGNEEERSAALMEVKKGVREPGALARRLRADISQRFSPESEKGITIGSRDPKLTASIRSWMLSTLIWCDPEHDETQALVLRHLNPSYEPDSNVRYWALAGTYERPTSYRDLAANSALKDEKPVVAYLAQAILAPDPSSLVSEFGQSLLSERFETVWQVLRILRIVAIPALAPGVCAQLFRTVEGVSLAYDVFYALSHPAMAAAGAPILVNNPGLDKTLGLLLDVAEEANRTASDHFVVLLGAMNIQDFVVTALRERATDARYQRVALRFLQSMRGADADSGRDQVWVPGYSSDSIDNQVDQLGIGPEVRTLTAIMLARSVSPPLAIGLFGDWGSGKSFFMRAMLESAGKLAERASRTENSKFCAHVVPIQFNAWHYADTNLWASLVNFILERLAEYVAPSASPEQRQAALLTELESAQAAKRATQAEKERAADQVKSDELRLQELRQQRQDKELRLSDLRFTDLRTLIESDREAKQSIDQALDGLDLPMTLNSVNEFRRTMSDAYSVGGRMASLLNALTSPGRGPAFIVTLLFVLCVVPLCAYVLQHYYTELHGAVIASTAVLAQVGAIALAASRWIRNGLKTVHDNLKKVEGAKKKVDELMASKRGQPTQDESRLSAQIEELKIKEQEAAARLAEASARVSALEERLRQLQEGSSLAHFLSSRTGSDDYRKHLGLVSMVRKDFDMLSQRLRSGGVLGQSLKPNPVERIVLYIDDLDRCPAAKVVEVLQAVHLLLAYPLFVVVVGVDSRWLLRSLACHYRQLQGESGEPGANGADEWSATPQHYLEKIFQIPFSLRPMGARGYSRLIRQLMGDSQTGASAAASNTTRRAPDHSATDSAVLPSVPSQANGTPSAEGPSVETTASASGAFKTPPPDPHARDTFEVEEEALVIRPWESLFAESLGAFIPSPRAAKRLTNVYRILKARITIERLERFEGSNDAPGEFQVPLLLLAILIFDARSAVTWFTALSRNAVRHDSAAAALTSELASASSDPFATTVSEMIRPIATLPGFPRDPRLLVDWIPHVARFSFDLARLVTSDAFLQENDAGTT